MTNFDKKEEKTRVDQWLSKLNVHNPGWVDGDLDLKSKASADMVNHGLCLTIELKREKGSSLHNKDKNLVTLSNRVFGYIKKTNKKFVNYPNYKTLCLIELSSDITALEYIFSNFHFKNNRFLGNTKNFFSESKNIGCFVFWPKPGSLSKAYYFKNPPADKERVLEFHEVEQIFGEKLKIFKINPI